MYAASSVCEAKQKMPEDIFLKINKDLVLKYEEGVKEGLLLGKHRIFAVDGTRLNLPREMVDCGYKKCNKDAYYPQGLMSCIYDINTHIVHDFCLEKNLNERICAAEHIKVLKKDDVVIFDRGYFSYLMLCQCMELRVHPIFRISLSLANKEIQNFLLSDKSDSIVKYTPSATVKNQLKRQGYNLKFESVELRLIKHAIDDKVYLYGTTLIGEEYPKELFGKIYHNRWDIEELYKISKCLVNLEEFSSKLERGLKQEIYAHFVLINITRFFANISQITNKEDKNTKYNFKNCLNIVGKNIQSIIFKSKQFIAGIIQKMIAKISRIKQKIRPKRKYRRISHKPFNRWVLNRSPHWT